MLDPSAVCECSSRSSLHTTNDSNVWPVYRIYCCYDTHEVRIGSCFCCLLQGLLTVPADLNRNLMLWMELFSIVFQWSLLLLLLFLLPYQSHYTIYQLHSPFPHYCISFNRGKGQPSNPGVRRSGRRESWVWGEEDNDCTNCRSSVFGKSCRE